MNENVEKSNITSSESGTIIIKDGVNLNKVVKIDNRLLESDFPVFTKGWTAFDLDWWNIIDSQAIDRNDNLIKIPALEMRNLMHLKKHMTTKNFIKKSNDTFKKFLTIQVGLEKEENGKTIYMNSNLFERSYIDTDYNAWIQVRKDATTYFNSLSQWTRFGLEQAAKLSSTYAKKLFMFLKQWRTVGKRTFTIEEFRKKLDVPKSYKPGSIDQKILRPASEELAPYFFNFKITKNYAKGVRGRKLIGYTFSFRPENPNKKEIGYARAVEDTIRIYSIMNNDFLSAEQRFRAVDRYRGLRLGTTQKYYESAHPQTYFLDPDDSKRSKRQILHREDLGSLSSYSLTILERLAQPYEELLAKGKLKEWDIQDLIQIEKNLLIQQVKLYLKTESSDKPYVPSKGLIATSVFEILQDANRLNDFRADVVPKEIERLVRQEFGKWVQEQDNRPYELKFDLDN